MTIILVGRVGNEKAYLLLLAAKWSHAARGVRRGISSDGRHLPLGKCTCGRQYVPVVNLRLLSCLQKICHPQSHDYRMALKLARGEGKECLYDVRIGKHMAQSSKVG